MVFANFGIKRIFYSDKNAIWTRIKDGKSLKKKNKKPIVNRTTYVYSQIYRIDSAKDLSGTFIVFGFISKLSKICKEVSREVRKEKLVSTRRKLSNPELEVTICPLKKASPVDMPHLLHMRWPLICLIDWWCFNIWPFTKLTSDIHERDFILFLFRFLYIP